jgi:hypothetical protein
MASRMARWYSPLMSIETARIEALRSPSSAENSANVALLRPGRHHTAIDDLVDGFAGPPIDVDPSDERRPVADAALGVDDECVDGCGRRERVRRHDLVSQIRHEQPEPLAVLVGHDGVQRAHEREDPGEPRGEGRRVRKRPRLGARSPLRDVEDPGDDPVRPVLAHDRPQVRRNRPEIGLRLLDREAGLGNTEALIVNADANVVFAQLDLEPLAHSP